MKRIILMLALASPSAFAGNYATCLLDKMENVKNGSAAQAASRLCRDKHPGGITSVKWGAGLGFWSKYKSPDECIYDRSMKTEDRSAARFIGMACRRLYSEAPPPECFMANPGPWCEYRNLKPLSGEYEPLPGRVRPYDGPYDPLPATRQ